MEYEQFLRNNRRRVNWTLNRFLWICVLTGPAIATGIAAGVFARTSYLTCMIISCTMALLAGSNWLLLKKNPFSYAHGVIALVVVDLLLCYMNAAHISIRLTWCIVPMMSLLFCDARVYVSASVVNYLAMGFGTWMEATDYAAVRTDFQTPMMSFVNVFAGCTIEALIMFVAGYVLGKATGGYYRRMVGQYAEAQVQAHTMEEQLDILSSMAEIYDYVNLISFTESTEMSLRAEKLRKLDIAESQDHTHMTQGLRSQIAADMLDEFWKFTDITTVPTRLINRKSIAGEFISTEMGWFRAQYIRVDGEISREPDMVIYTIQNIDADKQREEHLIRITKTDGLTRMFNRYCYEEDIAELQAAGLPADLALISADINGLKTVNDNLGHAAGDELIRGAADCLFAAVGSRGKVYRVGGDEFIIIVHTTDCRVLLDEIRQKAANWHGAIVDTLSLSLGCASRTDHPDADMEELERFADERMYADKALYYRQTGLNRRRS